MKVKSVFLNVFSKIIPENIFVLRDPFQSNSTPANRVAVTVQPPQLPDQLGKILMK